MKRLLAASAVILISTISAAADVGDRSTTHPSIVFQTEPGLPDHTVYRPTDLSRIKGKLPLVVFGNGGCVNVGNAYQSFLSEVASHGFVVVASGPVEPGWSFDLPVDSPLLAQTRAVHMLAAIDWAQAESKRADSPYRGRIDPTHIAAMGLSCGGLEAIATGADPRVTTVLVFNSGTTRLSPVEVARPGFYLPATEKDLPRLHTPVLYLIGGPTDQAGAFAEGDFERIQSVPVFNASVPVGHRGTWREPGGGEMAKVAIAWLGWQLKDDRKAARTFVGKDCALCTQPRWTVKKKNME